MDIAKLERDIKNIETDFAIRLSDKNNLIAKISQTEKKLEELESKEDILEKVSILLQDTAKAKRLFIKEQIENIGTVALQTIYGPNYSLKFELEQDKKVKCKIYVVEKKDDIEIAREPENFNGGGVVDVCSIALRFAMLQIYSDPKLEGPVLLDEPGKHVSKEYAAELSNFIKTLSEKLGRQIIFITHNEYMALNSSNIITISRENTNE